MQPNTTESRIKQILDYAERRNKGIVCIMNNTEGHNFVITKSNLEEIMRASQRDLPSLMTRIIRTAPCSNYIDLPPDSRFRKVRGYTFVFKSLDEAGRLNNVSVRVPAKFIVVPGISLARREGRVHIPTAPDPNWLSGAIPRASTTPIQPHRLNQNRTILERLREHWLTTERHSLEESLFGIELEFCSEQLFREEKIMMREGGCQQGCCPGDGEEREVVRKIPLPKQKFRDIELLVPGVKMKTDGSVRPSFGDAAEANLLAGPNGFARLERLCKEIRDRGGFINPTCGMHVHLDARKNVERVAGNRAAKLHAFSAIMKDLVPDSRLGNQYCQWLPPDFRGDRYKAVNLTAYNKYQTIEIRAGAGSLNPGKIWHWAKLMLAVSNATKEYPTWEDFLASNISLPLKMWAVQRANELRPNDALRNQRFDMMVKGMSDVLNSKWSDVE